MQKVNIQFIKPSIILDGGYTPKENQTDGHPFNRLKF